MFFGVFDFGADLDGVTAIMGVAPTAGWMRGDPIPPHATAKRTHSRWTLHSGLPAGSPFEEHLSALLDKLEPLAESQPRETRPSNSPQEPASRDQHNRES